MSNNSKQKKHLAPDDFESAFGEKLTAYVRNRIKNYDFSYRHLDEAERDEWLLKILQTLFQPDLVRSGEHRLPQWEEGWGENLARFRQSPTVKSLSPGYFGKNRVIRWKQDFIHPLTPDFEQNSLALIQDWLFDIYLREARYVYEFGCGTGHNLFRVRSVNHSAMLHGLDWSKSSQDLLFQVKKSGLDGKMEGRSFNLFAPDQTLRLPSGACIYTVAALEQIGQRFEPFLDYLLCQPVRLCIHIEPIGELLDPNHLLDYLSLQYFRKRNYLEGFLDRLQALEQEGRIRILRAQRSQIGSLFIDGYSVIVWEPV